MSAWFAGGRSFNTTLYDVTMHERFKNCKADINSGTQKIIFFFTFSRIVHVFYTRQNGVTFSQLILPSLDFVYTLH